MSVKERIKRFALSKERSVTAFEKKAGLNPGYINAMRVSMQPDKIQRIASNYPDLNTEWLLTGEGEMLKQPNIIITRESSSETNNCLEQVVLNLTEINNRDSASIQKLIEISDRNSRSLEKAINLLAEKGISLNEEENIKGADAPVKKSHGYTADKHQDAG